MAEATTYKDNVNDVSNELSNLEKEVHDEIFLLLSKNRPLGELPSTIDFLELYGPIYSYQKKKHGKLNGRLSRTVRDYIKDRLKELGLIEIRPGVYKHPSLTGGSRDNAIYLLRESPERRETATSGD
ncbi:MAG: hypothetical protein AABX48_00610 [Nanoarchaeota archaeon]